MSVRAAPYSLSVRLITSMVCAVCLVIFVLIASQRSVPPIAVVLVALPCLGIPVLSWLLSPNRYTIEDGFLTVHRHLGTRRIALVSINASSIEPVALHGSLRLLASGGLFGFFGSFYNRRWGKYQAYVTDPARSVVLTTDAGIVVLSPEDPSRFVLELERARNPSVTV